MAKSMTHSQGKGCLSHNNRHFKYKNVDEVRTCLNVIYVKQSIKDAYDECFAESVERYNAKQKRSDRKIDDYYFHLFNKAPSSTVVENANKTKSFYEDVVGIGDRNDSGFGTDDWVITAQCLHEYMMGFKERNPQFHVFNSVLHLDESTPHLHIDYIPVATGYSKGMDTQNGLAKALEQMGYGNDENSINRWRIAEREVLEQICNKYDIKIKPPEKSRGITLLPDRYKREKDEQIAQYMQRESNAREWAEEAEGELRYLNHYIGDFTSEIDRLQDKYNNINTALGNIITYVDDKIAERDNLSDEIDTLKTEKSALKKDIRSYKTAKSELKEVQPVKNLSKTTFGDNVIISSDYYKKLAKDAKSGIAMRSEIDAERAKLMKRAKNLDKRESELNDRKIDIEQREDNIPNLENEVKELKSRVSLLEKLTRRKDSFLQAIVDNIPMPADLKEAIQGLIRDPDRKPKILKDIDVPDIKR